MFLFVLLYFSFVAILSVYSTRHIRLLILLGMAFSVLVDGLRFETGTDWLTYRDHFYTFELPGTSEYAYFEPGYDAFVWLVTRVTANYNVFLLTHAVLVYAGIYYTVYTLAAERPIAIVVLYSHLYALLGSQRQLLALVFLVQSLRFLIARRFVVFAILIAAGSLFHRTLIAFLPCYWMWGIGLRSSCTVFAGVCASAPIGLSYFSRLTAFMQASGVASASHYEVYKTAAASGLRPGLAILKKAAFLGFPPLFVSRGLARASADLQARSVFFALCAAFSIPLYWLGLQGVSAVNARLDLYFGVLFTPLLAGTCESLVMNKQRRLALVLLLVLLSLVQFFQNPLYDLFEPYKGVLWNTDLIRTLY